VVLVYIISVLVFAAGMVGLSAGLILRGRSIRGHCGGAPVLGPDGQPLTCAHCTCEREEDAADDAPDPSRGTDISLDVIQ